jgi:UDP-2,3-diacylglucosamine pyrophosphatase LpxH
MRIYLVASDLHLSTRNAYIERFRRGQEPALTELLETFSHAPTASATVELILNGDTFDLLLTPPLLPRRWYTTARDGVAKLQAVLEEHAPVVAALRRFLSAPGRSLTILPGNHDLELFFPAVRRTLRAAIAPKGASAPAEKVQFCLKSAYRPFPDVHIEHGDRYDPLNSCRVLIHGDKLHDEERLPLPVGSVLGERVNLAFERRGVPVVASDLPDMLQAGLVALPQLVRTLGTRTALHHRGPHPLASFLRQAHGGSLWLSHSLADAAYQLLQRDPGVRLVIMGHTHRTWEGMWGERRYWNTGAWVTRVWSSQGAQEISYPAFAWLEREPGQPVTRAYLYQWRDGAPVPFPATAFDGRGWKMASRSWKTTSGVA